MMINLSERHSTADKQNLMQPPPGLVKPVKAHRRKIILHKHCNSLNSLIAILCWTGQHTGQTSSTAGLWGLL